MDFSRLIELSNRYANDNPGRFSALPGLSVYRREAVSDIEAVMYEPVICLILQHHGLHLRVPLWPEILAALKHGLG